MIEVQYLYSSLVCGFDHGKCGTIHFRCTYCNDNKDIVHIHLKSFNQGITSLKCVLNNFKKERFESVKKCGKNETNMQNVCIHLGIFPWKKHKYDQIWEFVKSDEILTSMS